MSSEYDYGCVFCRTGKENSVAESLENEILGCRTIVPEKLRYRRTHGVAIEEKIKLFPGYVFFRANKNCEIRKIFGHQFIYRILKNADGDWKLEGTDKEIVQRFFKFNGILGFSKVYYEGGKIRVIEGFLKDFEGRIVRVNHRAKTAQIKILIQDKAFSLWTGFELIEHTDS